jgi:hypothetical protein
MLFCALRACPDQLCFKTIHDLMPLRFCGSESQLAVTKWSLCSCTLGEAAPCAQNGAQLAIGTRASCCVLEAAWHLTNGVYSVHAACAFTIP